MGRNSQNQAKKNNFVNFDFESFPHLKCF